MIGLGGVRVVHVAAMVVAMVVLFLCVFCCCCRARSRGNRATRVVQRSAVYADNNASTQPFPEVVALVARTASETYANPGSVHAAGVRAKELLDASRAKAADLLGVMPCEVVFTSGATESNNIAIRGSHRLWEQEQEQEEQEQKKEQEKEQKKVVGGRAVGAEGFALQSQTQQQQQQPQGSRRRVFRVLTTPFEHASVYETLNALSHAQIDELPLSSTGHVDVGALSGMLSSRDVALVCVVAAHNEVGTIQNLGAISAACAAAGARLHLDLTQMVGRYDVRVSDLGAHTATCSAHKFHGPRGMGMLYVRDGVRLGACVTGGSQEMAKRAGTENLPGIVGMVAALEMCARVRRPSSSHSHGGTYSSPQAVRAMRDHVMARLLKEGPPGVRVNGHPGVSVGGSAEGLYNTLSVCVPDVDAQDIIRRMDRMGVHINAGCACAQGGPSHALAALGVPPALLRGALRMSFGFLNHPNDGQVVADALLRALREAAALQKQQQQQHQQVLRKLGKT